MCLDSKTSLTAFARPVCPAAKQAVLGHLPFLEILTSKSGTGLPCCWQNASQENDTPSLQAPACNPLMFESLPCSLNAPSAAASRRTGQPLAEPLAGEGTPSNCMNARHLITPQKNAFPKGFSSLLLPSNNVPPMGLQQTYVVDSWGVLLAMQCPLFDLKVPSQATCV